MNAPAIFDDLSHSEDEARYLAIGFSERNRLLAVVFTRPRPGIYRIVSARKATGAPQTPAAPLRGQASYLSEAGWKRRCAAGWQRDLRLKLFASGVV